MDFVGLKLIFRELALDRIIFGAASTARTLAALTGVAIGAFAGLVAARSEATTIALAAFATGCPRTNGANDGMARREADRQEGSQFGWK